jgi:hypothetical protein
MQTGGTANLHQQGRAKNEAGHHENEVRSIASLSYRAGLAAMLVQGSGNEPSISRGKMRCTVEHIFELLSSATPY